MIFTEQVEKIVFKNNKNAKEICTNRIYKTQFRLFSVVSQT